MIEEETMTDQELNILEEAVDTIIASVKERQPDRVIDWELFREVLLAAVLEHREELLAPQVAVNSPG